MPKKDAIKIKSPERLSRHISIGEKGETLFFEGFHHPLYQG